MANNTRTIQFKEKGLREIQSELANVESSLRDIENNQSFEEMGESIEDASIKADELSSELSSVNEQLENAPNPFDNLSKSFKGFTSAVGDGNIPEMTKNLNGMSKAIGSMDFKTTIKGIGGMGKAFASVGKSLLVNPLFLLGTALVVLVMAIIRVMDNMGLLEGVIDALTAPLRVLIGLFDKLTDALGLTNHAQLELAETQANAAKDAADEVNRSNDKQIDSLNELITQYELTGRSVDELKIKQFELAILSAQSQVDSAKAQAKLIETNRKSSEEDKKKAQEEVDNANHALLQSQLKFSNHFYKQEADKNAKIEAENERARGVAKSNQEKANSEALKAQEKADAERVKRNKATNDLIVKNEQTRINLLEEGEEKELAQAEFFYNKELAALEESNADEEEVLKAKELLLEYHNQVIAGISNKYRDEEKQKIEDFNRDIRELSLSDKDLREQELLEEHSKKLENYAKMRKEGLISQAQYDEAERLLAEEHKELLNDLASSNMFLGDEEEEKTLIEIIEEQAQLAFEHLEELREKNLISEEEYADKVKEIEEKKNASIKAVRDKEHKEYIKVLDEKVKASQQVFNSVGSLFSTMMDAQINAAEGNEAEQERIRERQFKAEQAFALVNVAINTAMATMKIMADTPTPAAPFVIAGNIAMGIAQMAAIASQKYSPQGGGGGGINKPSTVPTAKSVPQDSFGDSTERGVPNIDFFGTGSGDNDVNADGSNNGRGDIIINNDVRVSESEITNAQRTVINLDELNEL